MSSLFLFQKGGWKMNMLKFAIIEPIRLDWSRVAPKDCETLELFLTPDVSIVIKNIRNAKGPFLISNFMMGSATENDRFENEVLTQRSQERIVKAFASKGVSCFFKEQEGKELETLFEQEQFIARTIEVHVNARKVNLFEVSAETFKLVTDEFIQLNVVNITDFNTQGEEWQKIMNDIEEKAYARVHKEIADKNKVRFKQVKKKFFTKLTFGFIVSATTLALGFIGKRMLQKGGVVSLFGGLFIMLSWFGGVMSKHLFGKSVVEIEGVIV